MKASYNTDYVPPAPTAEVWLARLNGTLELEMRIGDSLHLPWVEVVGDDIGEEVLLGRTVLNQLRIVLNGPGLSVEITA